jgi:hypothetical protein
MFLSLGLLVVHIHAATVSCVTGVVIGAEIDIAVNFPGTKRLLINIAIDHDFVAVAVNLPIFSSCLKAGWPPIKTTSSPSSPSASTTSTP